MKSRPRNIRGHVTLIPEPGKKRAYVFIHETNRRDFDRELHRWQPVRKPLLHKGRKP
jgi:hypothetical protein